MVKITLPNPNDYCYEGGIKPFLRQLELCVHHARKAYQEIQKEREELDEPITNPDEFIVFRQPEMDFMKIEETEGCDKDGKIKIHQDKQGEEGQQIVLEINEV